MCLTISAVGVALMIIFLTTTVSDGIQSRVHLSDAIKQCEIGALVGCRCALNNLITLWHRCESESSVLQSNRLMRHYLGGRDTHHRNVDLYPMAIAGHSPHDVSTSFAPHSKANITIEYEKRK